MPTHPNIRSAMREQGAAVQPPYSGFSYGGSRVANYDSYTPQKQVTFESQNTFAGPDPSEPSEVPLQHSFAGEGGPCGSRPELPQHYTRRPSQFSTIDSYSSSDTDYSPLGTISLNDIDPALIQGGRSDSQFPIYLPGMPEVVSPGGLTSATSSPVLFNYHNGSPAQTAGYPIGQGGGYFVDSPNRQYPVSEVVSPGGLTSAASSTAFNYHNDLPAQTAGYPIGQGGDYFVDSLNPQQYPVVQKQHQPASGLQEQEPYPSRNGSKFALPSSPPDQPTRQDRKRDTVAGCPPPDPERCRTCKMGCVRQTDFERHLRTSKAHHTPNGPVCPVEGCKYTEKFTRSDNFKTHYKTQHGVSDEEADAFIADWKARRELGFE